MKLVFKIAAGVFIGIVAVFVVLAIPKWRERSRATGAERTMALLTPEQVISRCGNPAKDDTNDLGDGNLLRSVVYEDLQTPDRANSGTAVLIFEMSSAAPHWLFLNMAVGVNGETRAGEVVKIDNPVEQVEWLPCLTAK